MRLSAVSVGILAAVLFVPHAAGADIGSIPASYQVDPDGGFDYTIPISLPPGPNGVAPQLSLVYDSSSSFNIGGTVIALAGTSDPDAIPAGAGWTLAGLSMIQRTDATQSDNGGWGSYGYTYNDSYALDGNLLRLTSQNDYGQDGSTYQTEIANFTQVTAKGTSGSGPVSWTAQLKNGLTYEYGNTASSPSSQILSPSGSGKTRAWLLDKVSDANGNTYTITYGVGAAGSSGIGVPTQISWTPSAHGSPGYNYTVSFAYVARGTQEAITGFDPSGYPLENNNLLSSITVASGETTIRYYTLSYSPSVTGHSLLTSVQECTDSSKSTCFPATTFAYGSAQTGVSSNGLTAVSGATQIIGAYDFTGSGLSDVLYLQGSTLYAAFSNGSTLNAGISTGITPLGWVIGKVIGDGKDDILTSQNNTWWLYRWNGSAFTGSSLGIPYCSGCRYELADVNGDGLPDLVQLQWSSSSIQLSVALNTSSGGTPSFGSMTPWGASIPIPQYGTGQVLNAWFATPQAYFQSFEGVKLAGNGADDLMIAWQTVLSGPGTSGYLMAIDELVPSGSSFQVQQIEAYTSTVNAPAPQMFYGYFNRDAGPIQCTDFVQGGGATSGAFYSACNGTGTVDDPSNVGTAVGAVDWNGDGLTDLLMVNGNYLGVQTSTGTGFSSMITTTISLPTGATAMPLSVTGNASAPDIGIISGGTLTYYLHNVVDDPPDTMTSLTDGNGNTVKIGYASITGTGNAYTPTPCSALTRQETADTDTLFVVQALTLPDGLGGTYTKSYQYTDARNNYSRAQIFEGFCNVQITDSRRGEFESISYDQLFPYTGMMTEDDLSQSKNAPTISASTYRNADEVLSSTEYNDRHFPYALQVETKTYEVGGTDNEISDAVTAYSSPDAYGNFGAINTTVTAGAASPFNSDSWTTSTSNEWVDDASTWCLTLPSSVSVVKTAPGEPSITHTNTYTRDTSNEAACRPSQVVEDAGNASYDVTRAYQYDAFGNVSQVALSGPKVPAGRVWNYNWGTTGQFQVDIQDPVATAQNYEEAIGYDYNRGLKTSDVIQTTGGVQNTPPTTWAYDGLGQLQKEGFPDGTSLNWTYSACTPSSCQNDAQAFEAVSETATDANGTQFSTKNTYVDSLGRTVAATQLLMDGTATLTEQQYDQFGNIVKQSSPCNGSGCPAYWTDTSYDVLNRPVTILSPDPQNPSVQDTTQISYAGGTTSITNPDHETSSKVTDLTGAVRQTTDAMGQGQQFTLDSEGNILQVTGSAGTLTMSYDYGGEGDYLVSRVDPALGTWSYTPDALGDVLSYTDAKNQQFAMQYDGLGRPIWREDATNASSGITCVEPNVANTTCETNTSWTWGVTPSSHDVGELDRAQTTTAAGTYVDQRSYDAYNRLSTRAITIPGDATYTYSSSYNPQGLLGTMQYPAGGSYAGPKLSYAYTNGALVSVTDASAGTVYWKANAVNALGQITQDTLGNGIVTERNFLPTSGLLTRAISGPTAGSASVQNQGYLYDPVGNLTQRQQTIGGISLTENFTYDADNRVTGSQLVNGSSTATNLTVSYNSDGSIAGKTETGGTDTPVAYTPQWTSYNYPRSISATPSGQTESATFDYGPDRQRWRMVYTEGSASETTEYIGELMEKVSSSSGTQYRYYVQGGNELAAIVASPGTGTPSVDYTLQDQEGSLAVLLNSTGTVAANESFTAYGNRREASSWSGPPSSTEEGVMDGITRRGFTGQTVLAQMGLNHMNGRVEDAVTGTFLSPDPYIHDPYNTQDYNRYVYVYNNPLSSTDPTGFYAMLECHEDPQGFYLICPGSVPPDDNAVNQSKTPAGNSGGSSAGPTQTLVAQAFVAQVLPETDIDGNRLWGWRTSGWDNTEAILQQSNYQTVTVPGLQVTISSTREFPATLVNNIFAPWDGWQGFKSDFLCIFRCGAPGDGGLGAQLAALGPIAAPVGEGATVTRALTAADFGPQASLSALEGTLSVNGNVATVTITNINGNLGNAWSALNALLGAAQDAGATTLQLQGTVANPALMNALTRMIGAPGAGVLGGPQDIWTIPLGR